MDPVRVPESKIGQLEAAFEELARRAEKIGMTPPRLIKSEPIDVKYVEGREIGRIEYCHAVDESHILKQGERYVFRRFFECSCEGESPVIAGWSLIAVIDHTTDQEIGNLVRTVPGKECPVEYRKSDPICHHCNSHRRRNETFLIFKDGEYQQIGRNCLADFCRDPEMAEQVIHSAEYLLSGESAIRDCEDDGGYGTGPSYYPIEDVLALTRCIIRNCGWVSKAAAGEWDTPTSGYVSSVTCNRDWKKHADRKFIDAVESLNEEDKQFAADALAWIRSKKGDDSLNDYLYNLLVVCNQEWIPSKHFGLACSLIAAYAKDLEFEIERKLKATRLPSEHFGTVKKRETWKLLVTGIHYWEGDYGVTTFIRFRDEYGNIATWKASGSLDLEIGAEYSIKGTVKAHSDWKGIKQTELSRCKYERITPVAEEELLHAEQSLQS